MSALSPSMRTLVTVLLVVGLGAAVLAPDIAGFRVGIWGPDQPWLNRDFLGGWWLFWASSTHEGLSAWLSRQSWPDGALGLQHHIPNPFDGLLLGPLLPGGPSSLSWNFVQLGHHLGNLAAAAWLARAAGASGASTVVAVALVATSPVMLHEVAGGRTLSGVVWPGLWGLGLLLRDQPRKAGLLIGIQGLCYLYAGLLVGIVALILRPSKGLWTVAIPLVPYGLWLAGLVGGLTGHAPPAGFTQLPLSGLVGLTDVPERFRMHPTLLLGFFAPTLLRCWRLVAAAALCLLVAVGPEPGAALSGGWFVSPLAWVMAYVPGLSRMHHPVRAALILAPMLAVLLALALDRLPRWSLAAGLCAALLMIGPTRQTCAAGEVRRPAGLEAAMWLRSHGRAVVDLTGAGGEALALQPIHQRPMLEGLRRGRVAAGARRTGVRLRSRVDGWLSGDPQPGLADDLAAAGFSHVLVVERRGPVDVAGVQADLGAPVFPGVYALPGR